MEPCSGVEISDDTPVIEGLLLAHINRRAHRSSSAGASSSSGPPSQPSSHTELWGAVHTVDYDLSSSAASTAAAQKEKEPAIEGDEAASNGWGGAGVWTKCRAASVLQGASEGNVGLNNMQVPESTLDMLKLCKVLYAVNQKMPAADDRRVSAHDLVVGNLCRKASSAAWDPVALCTGKVPAWLRVVMLECPFLLSYDVRKHFFEMQAYGLTRALRAQARGSDRASSSSGSRQKVRVGRKRITESARKIMDMYTQVSISSQFALFWPFLS